MQAKMDKQQSSFTAQQRERHLGQAVNLTSMVASKRALETVARLFRVRERMPPANWEGLVRALERAAEVDPRTADANATPASPPPEIDSPEVRDSPEPAPAASGSPAPARHASTSARRIVVAARVPPTDDDDDQNADSSQC